MTKIFEYNKILRYFNEICYYGLFPGYSILKCPFSVKFQSFQWMSRVLQAVDSIHQVGIYCLALVPPNYLPKTPLGGIHLSETKRRFLEGTLHPANVLLCPHTCVTNLPKPREVHSGEPFKFYICESQYFILRRKSCSFTEVNACFGKIRVGIDRDNGEDDFCLSANITLCTVTFLTNTCI